MSKPSRKPVPASDAELRRRAEARWSAAQALPATPRSQAEIQRLLHELEVHQIELQMQNEELLQARAEVEAGLQRYTDLYEFAPVGYLTLDSSGTVSQANLTGARLLEVERGHLVGARFASFLAPGEGTVFAALLGRVLAGQEGESCEVALASQGDRRRWVRLEATAAGDRQQIRAVMSDITERRRAEEAGKVTLALQRVRNAILQMQSEEDWAGVARAFDQELRALIQYSGCGINIIDQVGSSFFAYVVDHDAVYVGVPVDHLPHSLAQAVTSGKPVYRRNRTELTSSGDGNVGLEVNSVIDIPFAGGTVALNHRAEDAFSERDIQVLEQFAPVLSEAYRRLQDLAERARIEQSLVRIQRLHAAAAVSAGVCHNLNNILTGVLLPAQVLQRMTDDGAMRELVDTIMASAERATELVHRLHQSVGDRDGAVLEAILVDRAIHQVVEGTRPRWKDMPEAQGVRIEVCTDLGLTPPIRGTETGFHDLLTNLLLNAVEAMPEGGTITIRTRTEGKCVRLDFRDTGVGMDEPTRARIFEPFFTTKANIGTGLGLSTLHRTVTQWGGTVEVDSVPGKGTAFTLRLPVWVGAIPAATPAQETVAGRPGRIAIVDDNEAVCRLLVTFLGDRHHVDSFPDAAQALERFAVGGYDVAIIDLGIPGMPGDQVARALQAIDPAVVRILFTGWELAAPDPRCQPFDLQLAKPVQDLVALESLVAQAIELHDQRSAAAGA